MCQSLLECSDRLDSVKCKRLSKQSIGRSPLRNCRLWFMGYRLKVFLVLVIWTTSLYVAVGDSCTDSLCGIHGDCVEYQEVVHCTCHLGYTDQELAQNRCQPDNPCNRNRHPCTPGTCHPEGGLGYTCTCNEGFIATEDEQGCRARTACELTSGLCANGVCVPRPPSDYSCRCDDGYRLSANSHHCASIDFCSGNHSICGPGGICRNVPGSYVCTCREGYILDEINNRCKDVNECDEAVNACVAKQGGFDEHSLNPYTGQCVNLPGSFRCVCENGFVNKSDDSTICEDEDECIQNHQCDLDKSECENTFGSYTCNCKWGYFHEDSEDVIACSDIDECSHGLQRISSDVACDPRAAICTNLIGYYQCDCFSGYEHVSPTQDMLEAGCRDCCIDINECQDWDLSATTCTDMCDKGTHADGLPIGTNYTCGCNHSRFPRTSFICDDCDYGPYGPWSDCSVECGVGTRTSTRVPTEGFGLGEADCEKDELLKKTSKCVQGTCDTTTCRMSPWSSFTECDLECGGGTKERTRRIILEREPGDCSSEMRTENKACNSHPCPGIGISDFNWKHILIIVGILIVLVLLGFFAFRHISERRKEEAQCCDDEYKAYADASNYRTPYRGGDYADYGRQYYY